MVAAFIRDKWPGSLAETVCALADVGERKREYQTSERVETMWWIGNIFRAWFRGIFKSKSS
jgi:hypothetical protein